MKKRILSILLTLVMVIGMLPTVAFAATEKTTVTQIELKGIYLPEAGEPCYGIDDHDVTTPSDAAYEFTPQFAYYHDAGGNTLTGNEKFEPGLKYYADIFIHIKPEYKDTHKFSADSEPTITFTDLDESLYKAHSVRCVDVDDDSLYLRLYFTLAGDNADASIDTLVLDEYRTPMNNMSFHSWYPEWNEHVPNHSARTEFSYLKSDGTEYYGGETTSYRLQAGQSYGLAMTFRANEDFTFADEVNISVGSGNPTITYTVSSDNRYLFVKLMEKVPDPDITSIEFGLNPPAAVINGNTVTGYIGSWVTESSDKYFADFNEGEYRWKDENGNEVTGQKFEIGKKYTGQFDFRAETGHSFASNPTVNITSGGTYVSHTVKKYSGDYIFLEVTVTPSVTLNFVGQSPVGSDGETTGLNVMTGEPQTYTFNSTPAPAGCYVEKTATLKGLFAGLDADKTVTVTDGSAATLTHTFGKAGMYQLKETLKLYKEGESTPVETKTHVFLISVSEKPAVVPEITQQPENATKVTGSHELSATAKNADRARWYKIGSDGKLTALDTTLNAGVASTTISSNTLGDRYYCAFWSVDNKIAQTDVVTVCFAPTVSSNGNVTVAVGNTAFLKVTESGCGHYAAANGWYKNGVELTSGDKYYIMGTTLAVQNAAAADAGTYTYKYVTEHGDEVTADVTLTVNTGSSSTTIDTFDITGLDNPVILGTVADTSVSVPTDSNYTVESVTWTAGVNGSGIVTGSSGMVSIKLKAKDSYTFKSGDLAGTVEGIYKTVYSVPANATEITVTVDYNNYSSWKIAYPANDTISISTDSLTFKVGTAANGQKIEGAFNCTHSGLADKNLHHTGMKYAVYSIADNAMPAGLTLNADGTITGTPTTAGVYTVMVRADSVNTNGTASNCSGLAVKAIEIVVESDAHVHDWNYENPDSDSATCTADGEKVISCKNGCGETITVTSPATGHDWGEWNDGNPIITPRCTDGDLVIERICANDPTHTEEATIKGIHMGMYWTTDENYHWKVCVYCHEAIVYQPELHADTNSDNKCDTCDYPMTPAVQPTEITELNATVVAPVAGESPSTVVTTTGVGYTVSVAYWYDKDENTDFSKFEAGGTYEVQVTFTPKEGYVLADEDVLTVTINGKAAELYMYREAALDFGVKFDKLEAEGGETPAPEKTAAPTITYEVTDDAVIVTAAGNGTVKLYANGMDTPVNDPYIVPRRDTEIIVSFTATAQEDGKTISDTATLNVTVPARVVTPAPVVPTTYTVIFAANGGAGTMADVTGISGEYTLPANGFTAPDGKQFKAWSVGGAEKAVGDKITVTADTTVIAVWEDVPAVHTCDVKLVAKDEPTCSEGGKEAYYKCEGCGKFFEDALGAKEITDLAAWGNVPENGHTESDWKSDKDNHWKECTVTACGVIIENSKAAHKDENKDGKCDVCEYNVGIPTTPTEPSNPSDDTPTEPSDPSDDTPTEPSNQGGNPPTGDNSMMWLWAALLFVSGVSIAATTVFGKKRFSVK